MTAARRADHADSDGALDHADSPRAPDDADSPRAPDHADSPRAPDHADSPRAPDHADSPGAPDRADSSGATDDTENAALDTDATAPASATGAGLPSTANPVTPPFDRKARAARIMEILDRTYPVVEIPLDHGDPFQLLVATILSAQCTDARVNLVTPKLFARAPDAPAMARMQARQIMPYIRTCGLAPSKASSLAKMSRILVAKHGGKVPKDLDALEDLPGVGHKTASVVMAQAFQEPAFPVDTHIHRLAGRWQLSRARTVEEVERDLKAVFPRERWSTLHLQIIYFGRQYCTARQHEPAECPICSWAMSRARADAERRQGLSKPVRPARPKRERAPTASQAPGQRPSPISQPPKRRSQAATAPKRERVRSKPIEAHGRQK